MEKNDFTLEKERVVERLSLMESQLKDVNDRLNRHGKMYEDIAQRTEIALTDIRNAIIGTPSIPGLAEKVRGIEGIFKHVYVIWVAVVAGIIDFLFRHLGGGK